MKYLLVMVLGAVLVLAAISGAGAPAANQLAVERTAQVQAQEAARTAMLQAQEAARTERLAIQEAARTERAAERAATLQFALVLLVVVVAIGGVVAVLIAWLRRPVVAAPPPPPTVHALPPPVYIQRIAAHFDGALDHDPTYGWIIVEPDGRFITVPDAVRLLEAK